MARDERYADLMSAAEALLFVSDEPVSAARLSEILDVSPVQIDEALVALAAEYMDENRGIQLREVAGGWRFYTHPAYHEAIERYVVSWDTHRMSQAALEALAVIAYHQSVTRATVNAIRGVNSESVVSSLVEKGLVREMGRDKPGGSILYGTTRTFLERFGLKSVKDLPPLEDFAPDDASREQIRERLSGSDRTAEMQLELSGEDEPIELLQAEAAAVLDAAVARVEEVDAGDEARVDDAEGVAEVIGQSMTEKVDDYLGVDIEDVDGILDAYFGDDDEAEPDEDNADDMDDDELDDEYATDEDDLIDTADPEEEEAYVYTDDEEPDEDELDDEPDDDDIELVG